MRVSRWASWAGLGLLLSGGVLLAQPAAEDDLQVVKKAVGSKATAEARPPAPSVVARAEVGRAEGDASAVSAPAGEAEPARKLAPPRRRAGVEPQWLRVRVVEKPGGRRSRVSVNLPLSLVRAVIAEGDDWPIDWNCGRRGRKCDVKLGQVLAALESGQELVEVDDENATVKIWVE